ncbi:MAG TPA: TIGR03088 family PEP-CTERM/XrtA system glycosyltransferase [Burkholderiaceae bacterium]|nr:TIGR03088 family PEP-CTERM/XrtA system glycosyltransferase [Burkholderiaceae bacterium]
MNDPRPLIAHVVFRFAVGGLENGVVNLINRMPRDRWRHAVIALTEVNGAFAQRLQREDVVLAALNKPPGHGVRLYPRLYKLFRELRPAIVHTRNLAALEAVVPAWAAGVPVRVHGEHGREHSDLDGRNRKYQRIRKLYRPFVKHYIALSHDLERYLIERIGVPAARVAHIYNGVDCARFRPRAERREPIAGSPFNDPALFVVGAVGRLEAVKDQTNLARAFVSALQASTAAAQRLRLVLVGDGPLRSAVEAIVRAAGAERLVWFAGERGDVAELLRGFDCFVLPSLGEGISNTLLEAMATGLPVIATRVGANADLMEEGTAGRLVPRADPDALARELLALLDDPERALSYGRAGRQIVERRFSLERMVADYESLYLRLLAAHGVRPAPAVTPGAAGG